MARMHTPKFFVHGNDLKTSEVRGIGLEFTWFGRYRNYSKWSANMFFKYAMYFRWLSSLHFPMILFILSYFRNIRRSLVSFLKCSAWETDNIIYRNPAWILCLPIIHFLDGSLQPFKELDFTDFRDKEKDWWLIDDFEKEKDDLKIYLWSRYLIHNIFIRSLLFKALIVSQLIH